MQDDTEVVYFDDTRAALVFALNAAKVDMPRPFMNKAMAEAKVKKWSKAALNRAKKAQRDAHLPDDAITLLERENRVKTRRGSSRPAPLRGLDAAHQAGYILSQLAKLDIEHRTVLTGLLTIAYDPCDCGAPCCSHYRRNARWAAAVKETCIILESTGDITREKGKRGLSTQPAMRIAFVEQFYTKNSMTVADAARIGQVSTMTATRHRDWIFAWLEQTETEAWLRADRVLDDAGVTGSFT